MRIIEMIIFLIFVFLIIYCVFAEIKMLFGRNKSKKTSINDILRLNFNRFIEFKNITPDKVQVYFEAEKSFRVKRTSNVEHIIVGKVVIGQISVGDTLNYINVNNEMKTLTVIGIEQFRKKLQIANEGDSVGLVISTNEQVLDLFKIIG